MSTLRDTLMSGAALGPHLLAFMPVAVIPVIFKKAQYKVARSYRVRGSYFSRSQGAPTSNQKMTLSVWIKLGLIGGTYNPIFAGSSGSGPGGDLIGMIGNQLRVFFNGAADGDLKTSAIFRDFTGWGHLVIGIDTTQATASDRVKMYWNGVQLTSFATASYPSLNFNVPQFNVNGNTNYIGHNTNTGNVFNGYYADMYWVDGQQLDPTSFAETDRHGEWSPKAVTGLTYGNNGFHLDFSNNSAATAAAIGADSSGNGNNWTPTSVSVTAGTTDDFLTESPTSYGSGSAGGDVWGNFCTWDAAWPGTSGLSAGNLAVTNGAARGSQALLYYDAYWTIEASGGSVTAGVIDSAGSANTTAIASGKVYGFRLTTAGALDYKNITDAGSWMSLTTGLSGFQFPYATCGSGVTAWLNTGQRAFPETIPSGYKSICTKNITNTTVALPASFTGNASADGPIIWANGVITAVTINGNVATRGTHFDAIAGGIKLRTSSTSYNASGSNTVTAYTAGAAFKYARAQTN